MNSTPTGIPYVFMVSNKKKRNETADNVLHTIYNEMDKLNAPIDKLKVDRAHGTGHKYKDDKGKWQQPVLLKFNSWKTLNNMYKLCKRSSYYMKADLTIRKEEVLNYAQVQIKIEGSMAKEYIKYVYPDANCNLMACTSTGRFLRFNTKAEFDSIILYVDNNTRASEDAYKINEWDYLTAGILPG